jgi:hypothetical protein
VVYNEKNKQFVAYFKLYLKGVGYETSYIGVTVPGKPEDAFGSPLISPTEKCPLPGLALGTLIFSKRTNQRNC